MPDQDRRPRRDLDGWRQLGARLQHLRDQAGLSKTALAAALHVDRTLVIRWEQGTRFPDEAAVKLLDQRLGCGSELQDLHRAAVARDSSVGDRDRSAGVLAYTGADGLDPECGYLARVQPDGKACFVPISRRDLLNAAGVGVVTAASGALVDSLTYVKPVEVFRLTHRQLIDLDNIAGPQRVIPLAEDQVHELNRAIGHARGIDLTELLQLRVKFAEFLSWLFQDLGDHGAAQSWANHALDWSYAAGDSQLTAYIMARKSQLAGDMRDSRTARGIGEAAAAMAPHPKLAAIATTYAAHGHALMGDGLAAERTYEQARVIAANAEPGCEWGAWLDSAYIDVHRAQSLSVIGDFAAAARDFDVAITELPAGYHRDRGVYLARAARAHAGAGDADHAAQLGTEALHIALDTRSGRTATELARLATTLAPVDSEPVTALRLSIRQVLKEGV